MLKLLEKVFRASLEWNHREKNRWKSEGEELYINIQLFKKAVLMLDDGTAIYIVLRRVNRFYVFESDYIESWPPNREDLVSIFTRFIFQLDEGSVGRQGKAYFIRRLISIQTQLRYANQSIHITRHHFTIATRPPRNLLCCRRRIHRLGEYRLLLD